MAKLTYEDKIEIMRLYNKKTNENLAKECDYMREIILQMIEHNIS